jgi:hypothetical protein
VLFRVLSADLHGFRVVRVRVGVNASLDFIDI